MDVKAALEHPLLMFCLPLSLGLLFFGPASVLVLLSVPAGPDGRLVATAWLFVRYCWGWFLAFLVVFCQVCLYLYRASRQKPSP